MGFTEAAKVSVLTSTSSPGPTPITCNARCSAAVPELTAVALGLPTVSQNSYWNASTCGPSGAIQLLANASATRAASSAPRCGGERWMRGRLLDADIRESTDE